MGGRQPLKIPFPSKDPRYFKCWNLIRKQGLSLEDALAKMGESPVPAPVNDQVEQAASSPSVVKDTPAIEKKPRAPAKRNSSNGNTVTAQDLLNHPGVPDAVKEQLRSAEESLDSLSIGSDQGPGPGEKSTEKVLKKYSSDTTAGDSRIEKPAPDILNPHLHRLLQRICTDLEEQTKVQVNIATVLERLMGGNWNRLCNDLEAINDSLQAMNHNLSNTRWGR